MVEFAGCGRDAVIAAVNYLPEAGQESEVLKAVSSGAFNLEGNEFA